LRYKHHRQSLHEKQGVGDGMMAAGIRANNAEKYVIIPSFSVYRYPSGTQSRW
jgi:hypothetical protein